MGTYNVGTRGGRTKGGGGRFGHFEEFFRDLLSLVLICNKGDSSVGGDHHIGSNVKGEGRGQGRVKVDDNYKEENGRGPLLYLTGGPIPPCIWR